MKTERRAFLGAVALALTSGAFGAGGAPGDLVLVRHGTLPIVLSVPHGGRLDIPGVPTRDPPDSRRRAAFAKWGGFHAGGDPNTDVLAIGIAAEIQKLTGHAPFLVLAKFKREYVDANRPAELGYAAAAAAPYYERYHRALREYVDEIRRTHSAGLLLDVHGEGKDPDVLIRGTANGRTVTQLVRRAGAESITGPRGLFGQLEAEGFKVFPSNRASIWDGSENAGFNGGFIVNTYGSQNTDGIDAVQLEFGTRYRRSEEVEKSAIHAARAIVAFYKVYFDTAAKERR
jgi:N-formylglutamate amidohydrolase